MTPLLPDLDAMLVALVLVPQTYSRNRFYEMYKDAGVRRARRRASTIRSVVRHVTDPRADRRGAIARVVALESGAFELTYVVPALGLRRTVTFDAIEMALVRFALGQARAIADLAPPLDAGDPDRARIEEALARLLVPLTIEPLAEPG